MITPDWSTRVGNVGVFALVLFAGCTASPPEPTLPSPKQHGDAGGPVGDTSGSWFWLNGTSGPEGDIAAFSWTLPPGAIVEGNSGRKAVTLEIVPLHGNLETEESTLQEWAIFAFSVKDGEAILRSMLFCPAYNTISHDVPPKRGHAEAQVAPLFFFLDADAFDLKGYHFGRTDMPFQVGETIWMVVVARSNVTEPFHVAFRPLDRIVPRSSERSELTTDAFIAAMGRISSSSLALAARGTGFHLAVYGDVDQRTNYEVTPNRFWTDTMKVTEPLPFPLKDAAHAPAVSLETHTPIEGFSVSTAYLYTLNGAGRWSAEVDLHGQRFAGQGTYVMPAVYGASAWEMLVGVPGYDAVGQGVGAAMGRWEFTEAEPSLVGKQWFVQATLGEPVTSLIGASHVQPFARHHAADPAASPIAWIQGDSLVTVSQTGISMVRLPA